VPLLLRQDLRQPSEGGLRPEERDDVLREAEDQPLQTEAPALRALPPTGGGDQSLRWQLEAGPLPGAPPALRLLSPLQLEAMTSLDFTQCRVETVRTLRTAQSSPRSQEGDQ